MNRLLAKVVDLLGSEDRELRWAAARTLGGLEAREPEVTAALVRVLDGDDRRLKVAALKALASIGDADSFDSILPHIDEPGEVGDAAVEALAVLGPKALGRLKTFYPKAGDAGRQRILTLGARFRGAAGLDIIVRALERGDVEALGSVIPQLAAELSDGSVRERKTLARKLDQFLEAASGKAEPGSVAAALDLLARIDGGAAQERLLEYANADHPPRVRQRALEALARIAPRTKLKAGVPAALLDLLKEVDFTHVVAPAMSALERAKLDASHEAPLRAHLTGNDPALRRFAASALGQVDTPGSAEALIEVLRGDNPDLQKRAADSLSRLAAAVPAVVSALTNATDPTNAWVLARILRPNLHRLKPDQVKALASAAAAWLEPGDPRAEAVVMVLLDRFAKQLEDICLGRARRLKRDRRAGEIVNLLRPLVRDGIELEAATRYELAVAEVVRGPKDVVRAARIDHAGLILLEGLLAEPDFPLITRLKRDKNVLEPEEYYLIGCHFAERPFAERAFGGELLRWIVQTFPDDSSATAAEHKLHMEGFPPPPRPKPKPPPRPKSAPKSKPSVSKRTPAAKKKAAPSKKKTKSTKKTGRVAKRDRKPKSGVSTVSKKSAGKSAKKKKPALARSKKASGKKTSKKASTRKTPRRK